MLGVLAFCNPPRHVGAAKFNVPPARARRMTMVRAKARRRARSRDADNPRGYIKYRGKLIASAPFYTAGRIVPKRRNAANPRRRKARKNPLWRGKSGRFMGPHSKGRAVRALKFQGASGWKNNPRKRRRSSNPWVKRHWRKAARRNPWNYADNARRPARRRLRLLDNPITALTDAVKKAFSMETLEAVFHTGLGFGGTAVVSRLLFKKVIPGLGETGVGRVATTLVTGIASTGLVAMLTGNTTIAARVLAGGMLTTLWQGVSDALTAYAPEAKEFIPTLGESPQDSAFRTAIQAEVLKELQSGSGGQRRLSYLQPMGMSAYLTQQQAEASGVGAYLTRREATTAGVGDFEIGGGRGLAERF